MKTIILAAGRGSRMGEGTANIPKCMMKLWDKTLIEMCIDTLEKAGISRSEIGIVTGYKKEKFEIQGVNYFHNADWETTNMFMSLTMASEWLKSEPCLICYSDIVFNKNAVEKLAECNKEFAITYYTGFMDLWKMRFDNPLDDMETFKINEKNIVTEIGMKPNSLDEVQGQYMGLLRFEPSGWAKIEEAIKLPMRKTVQKLDMTTLLNHLISLGNEIYGIKTDELWLECDNQNDIDIYEKEFKKETL